MPSVGEVFSTEAILALLVVDGEGVGKDFEVEALYADVGESVEMELFEFDFVLF